VPQAPAEAAGVAVTTAFEGAAPVPPAEQQAAPVPPAEQQAPAVAPPYNPFAQ
jgi:hypothetical protein